MSKHAVKQACRSPTPPLTPPASNRPPFGPSRTMPEEGIRLPHIWLRSIVQPPLHTALPILDVAPWGVAKKKRQNAQSSNRCQVMLSEAHL